MSLVSLRANGVLDKVRHETVTVGDVSTLIVPRNENRRLLIIQNDGNTSVYISHGEPATVHHGIRIDAGDKLECSHSNATICNHAVYAIKNTGGAALLLITEGE